MSNYAPEITIGRGKTRIEVWTENGSVYPHPTGIVSRKIEDVCNGLRGQRKPVAEVVKILAPELIREVTL